MRLKLSLSSSPALLVVLLLVNYGGGVFEHILSLVKNRRLRFLLLFFLLLHFSLYLLSGFVTLVGLLAFA